MSTYLFSGLIYLDLRLLCYSEVKWKLLSRIQLFATPGTVAYQSPLSMKFSS